MKCPLKTASKASTKTVTSAQGTTVICVDGYGFRGFVPDLDIVKALVANGATVQTLAYDNISSPTPALIRGAASNGMTMAKACSGPVVFVSVSEGSQVMGNLLWLLRSDPIAGLTKLGDWTFVLCANPEHVVTGRVKAQQYGTYGIPDDTPYPVTDVAAEYDYWADAPNVSGPAGWAANSYVNTYGNAVHTGNYFAMDPTLPFPFVQRGNIRDMWAPMPSKPWGDSAIEAGYNRPVKL